MTANLRDRLETALIAAVRGLGVEGELPDLELVRAKNPAHGDYASSAGLKLARVLRQPPAEIARQLAAAIVVPDAAAVAEAVGGYVNFRLQAAWLQDLVREVARTEVPYGRGDQGGGRRIQVEFASVNPTGPLHIGHGRGVILGDSLARLLEFTGYAVQREYYVNDSNTQARKFGMSVYARLHGQEPPEGGYAGEYVAELARSAGRDLPGISDLPEAEAEPRLRSYAIERMVELLAISVGRLNVRYDEWFRESRLWEEGLPQRAIERLQEGGHLVQREGATWFRPDLSDEDSGEPLIEDEERVVIRSSGEPTYFASDLGYFLSKFEVRDFEKVIYVWGADHHGYIPRMRAALDALGIGRDRITVILNQIVNLKEGKMSKRLGRFVPLDELVDKVGPDAVRYFYLLRSPEAMMEFDLDLAVSQSNENPVYYAQYAHARMANVEVFAAERELPADADLTLLTQEWELDLIRQLAYWPDFVAQAAELYEPHRIPYYIHDLADRVHGFYQAGNRDPGFRIVVDDRPDLTRARLELCRAAGNTLRAALGLMGVGAPDRM